MLGPRGIPDAWPWQAQPRPADAARPAQPRYLELLFGAWWAGLVVVPVSAKLHIKEVQWIVENSAARWAFVTSDVAPDTAALTGLGGMMDVESAACTAWLEAGEGLHAVTERHADDTAWLFYTSGTTGRPKGAMITHRNLMTMGLTCFNDVDHVDPSDAIAYAAPMSDGAGLYAIPPAPRRTHRLRGRAQTPVRLRIAGPGGEPLPAGEVGEVLIQGDSVMAGYWRNTEATAAAVRDGWLWTGDMGALDVGLSSGFSFFAKGGKNRTGALYAFRLAAGTCMLSTPKGLLQGYRLLACTALARENGQAGFAQGPGSRQRPLPCRFLATVPT